MSRLFAAATVLLAFLPLSGCLGSGGDSFDFVPGTKFKATGNEVHLRATVRDYNQRPYEGLDTYLWAFCFAPVDPADGYSANAIEGFTQLPGDAAVDAAGNPIELAEGEKCGVPGPTLRVKQGDRVIVEFQHSHFHPHTIHWHGQFVQYLSDGAPGVSQDAVPSGGAYTYDFIAKRAGTLWYHCHVDTQTHVMQGLYGMMIVEPQDKKYEPKGIDAEYNLVLSTMNRNMVEAYGSRHNHPAGCASGFPDYNGVPCENPVSKAGEPDVFLLNGHSYPLTMDQPESLIKVKEGDRVRIRILNAGETIEELHLHGHDMQVVAKDGNPLSKSARYWADTIKIGPAERYDVVVTADNPGPWMIHTHVSSHETNCGKAPGGMHTMLVYEDFMDKMHEFKAESPVDCPKGETLELPSDFSNTTSMSLSSPSVGTLPGVGAPPGTGTIAAGTWTFPVTLPCAVRGIELYVNTWQSAAAAAANAAQVNVVLTAPDGAVVETKDSVDGKVAFVYKEHSLNGNVSAAAGDYFVDVSGSGQDVKIDLQVSVDYYETFEQSKIGHLTYKVGGCPGYT